MKVESNQSHIDVTVLEYGNQAAFFKLANDNAFYQPTKSEPYSEQELPVEYAPGTELMIDKDSDYLNIEQMKILNKEKLKATSKIQEE